MEGYGAKSELSSGAVKIAAVAFLLIATFPGEFEPIRTGLDASYRYALNALVQTDHVFGRDVAFTFGPLGYLLIPLDIGNNLLHAVALWLTVHALFAGCVIRAARRAGGPWPVVLFATAYVAAMALGLPYEYHLLIVTGLLVMTSLDARRLALIPASAAGLVAALGLTMKFTLGVAAAIILLAGEVVRWTRPEHAPLQATMATFAGYATGFGAAVWALFGSPVYVREWMATSLELTSGFSSAMSLPSHPWVLAAGTIALAAVVSVAVLLMKKEPGVLRAAVILCVPVLLSFKHGFVRQDVHIVNFFPFAVAVIAVFLLYARRRDGLRVLVPATMIVVLLAMLSYARSGILDAAETARGLAGVQGLSNVRAFVYLEQTRTEIRTQSRINLEAKKLPESWQRSIRQSGETIDVFPWEVTYAPANDLPWSPNPILQSYTAYTASLDEKSAGQYARRDAPAFVIAEYASIDMRHPLLDAPATVREILRNYTLLDGQTRPGRLLLRRTAPRFPESLRVGPIVRGRSGEWIDVPRSSRLLFVELAMHLTPRGQISEAAFRVPPVSIEVVYGDGRRETYRFVPATARNGMLMNYLPSSLDDLAGLFLGSARGRVVKFRIGGSGALLYSPEFDVVWKEADYTVNIDASLAGNRALTPNRGS